MLPVADAASRGDVVMVLLPDEKQAEIWEREIADGIAPGNLLLFAHGFSIHFDQIEPGPGVDVGMVAPKGPGHLVRRQFAEGKGVPGLIAVHQDASGNARDLVLAYAKGIGCTRARRDRDDASRRRPRPTSSASRPSSAAASPSWSAPATRRSSRPATTRASPTSSASTSSS